MWTIKNAWRAFWVPGHTFSVDTWEGLMLNAVEVKRFLQQFEPLRHVEVDPVSDLVLAPHLVRVHGIVMIYGEPHNFEADLDLREFGGADDLLRLAKGFLISFAGAAQRVNSN